MTLFIVSILIAGIWILVELKRLKHKIFAIFLIALILFTYVSFMVTIKGQDIDLTTIPGLATAGKLYFVWVVNIFDNVKTVTAQVINMDWTKTS